MGGVRGMSEPRLTDEEFLDFAAKGQIVPLPFDPKRVAEAIRETERQLAREREIGRLLMGVNDLDGVTRIPHILSRKHD